MTINIRRELAEYRINNGEWSHFNPSTPPTVDIGQRFTIKVPLTNYSPVASYCYVYPVLYDPSGTEITFALLEPIIYSWVTIEPGTISPSYQLDIAEVGTYSMNFRIYENGKWVDEWETVVCIGAGEAVTGILSIDTTPVKGEVFVDGVSWGIALQSQEVEPGLYQVIFGDVAGYSTPQTVTVQVFMGETTSFTGIYEEYIPVVYTCPYCGAPFATQEERDTHIILEHPEMPPVPPEKKPIWPWVVGGVGLLAIISIVASKRKR